MKRYAEMSGKFSSCASRLWEVVRDLGTKMERQHDKFYNIIEEKFDRVMDRLDVNSKQITRILIIGATVVVLATLVFSALNWYL